MNLKDIAIGMEIVAAIAAAALIGASMAAGNFVGVGAGAIGLALSAIAFTITEWEC